MGSHPARRTLAAISVFASLGFFGVCCGGSPTSASPTVASIAVTGLQTYTTVGVKAQYQAVATLANGTTSDVSTLAVWASSDPSHLSMTTGGLSTYLGGSELVSVMATYKGVVGTALVNLAVSSEDCTAYSPGALFPAAVGDAFIVTDGHESFFELDNLADAANTVALMQPYSSVCYVGRNNSRANRLAYIVQYWKPAGPPPTLAPEDCVAFSNSALKVTQTVDGYGLFDGGTEVALLDSQSDADLLLTVAKQYSARCYIGRANTRPNPLDFIAQYWK